MDGSGVEFKAAQYVRVSTEHQQYSTLNRSDKIPEYADARDIEVIKTYADDGKSGLSIGGRAALQQLIEDVETGRATFNIILVYDVSSWGRFQDADESAYYEYICKRAGINVAYCAEQFENDGSPVSTIVKGIKCAMAGECSRKLSVKVFAGQCRLIELGFRQGGAAGFGLRRVLVNERGEIKGELLRGEHKSLQTDRVILMPGPDEEVAWVNKMYRWLIKEDLSFREIADRLNEEGVTTDLDRPWNSGTVRTVLTNEKHIGNNVYNRSSFKLKKLHVENPHDMWVRGEGAFEGIVPLEFFLTAREIITAPSARLSDEELLDHLKRLYADAGQLSGVLMDQTPDMPSSWAYRSRFGSLARAYEMIGYRSDRNQERIALNKRLRGMHPEIIAQTEAAIAEVGGTVARDPKTDLLTINNEMVVSLVLARCQPTGDGRLRWRIRFDPMRYQADVTLAVRLDPENREELDYYLLPWLTSPGRKSAFANAPASPLRRSASKTWGSFTAWPSGSAFAGSADEGEYDGNRKSTKHERTPEKETTPTMTDTPESVTLVPIDRIEVLNSRDRNMKVFEEIVENIRSNGLKKPITVTEREGADGAPAYLLVCGEGRLNAFRLLGESHIPALVVNVTDEDAFIMSLAENIARRGHRPLEILADIELLLARHCSIDDIIQRTGLSEKYVRDIVFLLEKGEERLIEAVQNGTIPLTTSLGNRPRQA